MKRAALFGLFLLVGCRRDPQPVSVVSPATRPDLKLNAFLLSNNTILGCKDWKRTAQASKNGAQFLNHEEPPIEGFDGSFILNIKAQPLLGTGPATLKTCATHETKDEHNPVWALGWQIWKADGSIFKSGAEDISALAQTQGEMTVRFEAVSGNPSLPQVTIARTADSGGQAWTITETSGQAFDQTSATPKIAGTSGKFRMKEILIPQRPPITLVDAAERGTCAAFKICHDNEDCALLPVPPAPCSPNPPGDGGGPARQ